MNKFSTSFLVKFLVELVRPGSQDGSTFRLKSSSKTRSKILVESNPPGSQKKGDFDQNSSRIPGRKV